jgi:SMC interacting uncharacterized protein involved in chromosome segregation
MEIEIARKKLELKRVELAKDDMEFTILERMADIERLKKNIQTQETRIKELQEQISKMEG